MNTREAIEILKGLKGGLSNKHFKIEVDFFNDIIKLLQRGETDYKIIEKLKNIDANINVFSKSNETISVTALDIYLDEIRKEVAND